MNAPIVLLVAKAPVPGLAKTRIGVTVGPEAAAEIAAAALLDTLVTVTALGWPVVVAMTGDLHDAVRGEEIARALDVATIVPQRGDGLGQRLAHAHADAGGDAEGDAGVVQVGMDTPQLTVADYLDAGHHVARGNKVIGPADDGGWWLLGLPDPSAAMSLVRVEMSQDDTLEQTEGALGGDLVRLRSVQDMDTWQDAVDIAGEIPLSHLAAAVDRIGASR